MTDTPNPVATNEAIPPATMDCPECNGDGWVLGVGTESGHGCDGTPEGCAATCPVPVQVQTQEPCNYCRGSGEVEVPA